MAKKYLLLARDPGDWSEIAGEASPEEIQAILDRYVAWTDKLAKQGRLLTTERLKDGEGRVLKGQGSDLRISDGPHTASKEVIGGFWIFEADSYDHAVSLVTDSPHLQFGGLELREIDDG